MASDKELMTPEAIENLGELLSADGINFVRANQWGFDHKTNTFFYDGSSLQGMTAQVASGLTFHNMSHARYSMVSQSRKLGKEFAEYHARHTKDIPRPVVPLIYKAIADERAEHKMRERYPNLENADLPKVGQGYRKNAFDKEVQEMQTVSQPGEMSADQKTPQYWKRAATAIRGLTSGYIDAQDLPADMQWPSSLVQRIKDTVNLPTADAMVDEMYSILDDMIQYRTEPPPEETQEPQSGEGEGEGEAGEGEGQGQGQGQGTPKEGQGKPQDGKGQGQGQGQGQQPKPGPKPPTEKQVSAEVTQSPQGSDPEPEKGLFGGNLPGTQPGSRKQLSFKVSYNAIRSSVIGITNAIKKAINVNLKDNEVSDVEHAHRSGRVSGRHFARFAMQGNDSYHAKRSEKGEKQYAFAFAIDVSGSMNGYNNNIESHPELFNDNFSIDDYFKNQEFNDALAEGKKARGSGGRRCEFAVRTAVAFIEAFARFKEVKTAVSTFDYGVHHHKPFSKAFTDEIKQDLVKAVISPNGGTSIQRVCDDFAKTFREVHAEGKALVVLTDGGLSSGDVEGVKKLRDQGVTVIGILLDCEDEVETAEAVFGKGNWDNVSEYTIGKVIGRHLRKVTGL